MVKAWQPETPAPEGIYDLLIIGGGINGAGLARDAAMRGLRVCLVEKNDWGWGTSAKSSMLAHGGLRYLEQLEFGLVHEALQDRERMLAQAPHLVRPLRFLYPIYPHVAARRVVRVGLWLYDRLSYGKSLPNRQYLRKEEVLQEVPGLEPHELQGGATYYDGQIESVERFIAELIWDATRHGATCLNHATVTTLNIRDDNAPGKPTGQRRCDGATIQLHDGSFHVLRARATINAAGTWVDEVLGSLGKGKPPKIRKTKGVHVAVPRFTETALIVKAATDGRTFFILPWKNYCLLGTTDTDYEGDAGQARADPEDVAYLLDETSRYFPHAPLDQIQYTYAGVRALVNEEGLTESNVTRRHILYDHGEREGVRGLWTLQGGKITTYRSLAEEAVQRICIHLGRKDLAKLKPTRNGTLPGGPLVPWDLFRREAIETAVRDWKLPEASAEHLVATYGARWQSVLQAGGSDGTKRVRKPRPEMWCQVEYAVREEEARTVADVMLRRTQLGIAADGNPRAARAVAGRMAELLGWDRTRIKQELERYARESSVYAVPT